LLQEQREKNYPKLSFPRSLKRDLKLSMSDLSFQKILNCAYLNKNGAYKAKVIITDIIRISKASPTCV